MATRANCVLANQLHGKATGTLVPSAIGGDGNAESTIAFTPNGKFDYAAIPNGNLEAISFDYNAQYNQVQGCVRMWVNPQGWTIDDGDPSDATLHYMWSAAEVSNFFEFMFADGGFRWRFVSGGANQGGFNSATAITDMDSASGAWHHIAVVWDKNGIDGGSHTQRVYWDKVLLATSTTAISAMPSLGTSDYDVGNYEWSGGYEFGGYIDNVQVFNTAEIDHSDYLSEWFSGVHLFPYTSGSHYTYDADLIEFVDGEARLKQYAPASKAFHASYDVDEDADYSLDSVTGTLTNGAVITAAQKKFGAKSLYPDGSQADSGVSYAASTVDGGETTFTWQKWYRPEYSGTPGSAGGVPWMSWEHTTGNNNSRVQWRHSGTGVLQVLRRDTLNVAKNYSGGSWSPTAGNWYQLVYVHKSTSPGASRFFVDGVQIGTTDTQVFTRTARNTLYVGRWMSSAVAPGANKHGWIDDVLISGTVLYTANFTPIEAPITGYAINEPSVLSDKTLDASVYSSFAATTGGTGSVQFIIQVGGQDRWWDGDSWEDSDGTWAESNTAATINTNIGTLTAGITKVKALLQSDGTQEPTVDLAEIAYTETIGAHPMTMQRGYW